MYRFEFKAYRRSFAGAFSNARERFSSREGIWLRIEDAEGRVGFGEVAPIPSFGTESFAGALSAAASIGDSIRPEGLFPQLNGYRALRWGLESAIAHLDAEGCWPELANPWAVCRLLGALDNLREVEGAMEEGFRCLKFKIGVSDFATERRELDRVVELTGGELEIRLDGNASLSLHDARLWLQAISDCPVEFLEQPLAVGSEDEMLRLAADFPTPLALDESVCAVDDLKRWRDAQWPGVFVVKPSLAGSRSALLEELKMGPCDLIFSTALETKIGAANALSFALNFEQSQRALGFGAENLFLDKKNGLVLGAFLQSDSLPSIDEFQFLWNQI